jgi:DNA-binding response OmpR family regulator
MPRVLILEDSPDLRQLLQLELQAQGFEVAAASSGDSALELMERAPADVVLTDLFMPDKDGLETILELRARYPGARIVAMSGWESRAGLDYLKVAREIGAERTFRKPFDIGELIAALRQP